MHRQSLRARLGLWLLGQGAKATGKRQYSGARNTRSTGSTGTSSADAELANGLTTLRNRSRAMVRDSAYAKRAKKIVVNNVIGAGVRLQAQVMNSRGQVNERVNAAIERVWEEWCAAESCHTGGKLHFNDMERLLMGQVFEAGESFDRMHLEAFGSSPVRLALEVIESERLPEGLVSPQGITAENELRMGIEVDRFHRALAYYVRRGHPGDLISRIGQAPELYDRVPAEFIHHLHIVDRWPQTRGEPWLHCVLRKIDDMNEYTQLEVTAARGSAAYFATIETPEAEPSTTDDEEDDGTQVMSIDPLTVQQLAPGEKLEFHAPNRPNTALDPFMRAMLREVAAGVGPSYESLSRDYSQSNYSSSRLGLLDDRDLWRILQQWWLRSFRLPLHKVWLRQAVLGGAIPEISREEYALNPAKFEAVRFKPRGWTWVDPTVEVKAFKEAIKGGLTTLTDVIAATGEGRDIEDFVATRKRELEMLAAAGVLVDTTVVPAPVTPDPAAKQAEQPAEGDGADAARVLPLRRNTA